MSTEAEGIWQSSARFLSVELQDVLASTVTYHSSRGARQPESLMSKAQLRHLRKDGLRLSSFSASACDQASFHTGACKFFK